MTTREGRTRRVSTWQLAEAMICRESKEYMYSKRIHEHFLSPWQRFQGCWWLREKEKMTESKIRGEITRDVYDITHHTDLFIVYIITLLCIRSLPLTYTCSLAIFIRTATPPPPQQVSSLLVFMYME